MSAVVFLRREVMSMKPFACTCLVLALFGGTRVGHAQAVQLPTFRFFGTSGTVLVPDRGYASMGGNTSAYSGSSSRGLPGTFGPLGNNRGIAAGGTTGGVGVTAWIHDMEDMDTAILGMPVDEFQRQVQSRPAGASFAQPAASPQTPRGPTLAEERHRADDEAAIKSARAREHWNLAQSAQERGKTTLAAMYYRIALRDAIDPTLRANILSAQARLQTPSTPVAASPGATTPR
ncbi:MAG: hypothetical protein QM811_24745 [Pirellulales bacterium]